MRPLRRANFSGLLLGEHVFPEADRTRIVIPATQTKMGKGPMPPTGRTRFGVLTAAHFGAPITLHRFRTIAATTLADESPENIHLATEVLGHADVRSRDYYIRASGLIAARRSHEFGRPLAAGDTCENET